MKIGVIGGGRVGGALAATWSDCGHEVVVSKRDRVAETAAGRDVVVLALPASAAEEAVAAAGLSAGQIVVDATNNLSGGPSGTEIAAFAPSAHFVKAFNTVFSTFMHDTPPDPPATLVYSGDDAGAKATVAQLITDAGFEPVDAGGADATPLVEAFAKLVIGIAYRQGRGPFVYRFHGA
ncbi:MAG: NADPH-dependent F420 reductase [Gaiellaceae bacterium]